jgi:hypothetical protein
LTPTDSIPPEDSSTRIRLEALTLTVQALVALLLPLEGAVRELLGEVRAERAARLAASAQAAQPHPLSAALADALRTDPSARRLAGFGILILGASLGILALSGVSAEPGTATGAIIAVVDHHLPGGSP